MTAAAAPSLSPVLCFETEVVRLQRLSPAFLRVTFGGPELADFHDGGPLGPRDLRIKVIVPVGGRQPQRVEFAGTGWYQDWLRMAPEDRGEMRTYTIRAARTAGPQPEVDVDFVLHDHDGQEGPAAAWAVGAQVGDRMLLMGPNRACPDYYGGIEWRPPVEDPREVLLVGDETAVPAIASILETLPAGYVGRAIVEVPQAEDFLPMPTAADVEVTWLARTHHPRGQLLSQVVREAIRPAAERAEVPDVDADLLWETPVDLGVPTQEGTPYVWIAGEAGVVKELRRYLVGEAGLPRSSVSFMGYWRIGKAL